MWSLKDVAVAGRKGPKKYEVNFYIEISQEQRPV